MAGSSTATDAPDKPLSLKQESFVAAYLGVAHGNATEAARIAGYAKPRQEGSRLLTNAVISARVAAKMDALNISPDAVLQELASVAFAEWHDFVEVVGRAKDGEVTKVRSDIGSKVKALELLGKYHQLFTDRVDITGDMGVRYEIVGIDPEDLA